MVFVGDFHIHSRFSRACSKDISVENLEKWARIKGVDVLGTGDFTHAVWLKELKDSLSDDGSGILRSKTGQGFVLATEVSNIYTQEKGRRVHSVLLAPDFGVVDQINEELGNRGRLDYDGRPIFGFSCVELVELMRSISKDIEVVPAHVWTPWFSVFGSKSGFDSVTDCFKDQAKHIHALETGMSSDPLMNRRVSRNDRFQMVSFSDSHSMWPWRLGREATLFDGEESYAGLLKAIRTGEGLHSTIEVDPGYGKYHVDGHRACGVVMLPEETRKAKGICPVCKKALTIGVEYRVEELADRSVEEAEKHLTKPFLKLIPLHELISGLYGKGLNTGFVWNIFNGLLKEFGSELNVLLNASQEELVRVCDEKMVDVILKNRRQEIEVRPGYDGVYGVPLLGRRVDEPVLQKGAQKGLGEFF
ncbi:DNA helicase UvrD [Candidatus Woesearchaeota archaeon]|nr:DNA helicase UvrD [Candidatus Woesearchaeota archaeon]